MSGGTISSSGIDPTCLDTILKVFPEWQGGTTFVSWKSETMPLPPLKRPIPTMAELRAIAAERSPTCTRTFSIQELFYRYRGAGERLQPRHPPIFDGYDVDGARYPLLAKEFWKLAKSKNWSAVQVEHLVGVVLQPNFIDIEEWRAEETTSRPGQRGWWKYFIEALEDTMQMLCEEFIPSEETHIQLMLNIEHRASIVYVQALCMMRAQFEWGVDTNPEPCPKWVAERTALLRAAVKEARNKAGEWHINGHRDQSVYGAVGPRTDKAAATAAAGFSSATTGALGETAAPTPDETLVRD